MPTQQVIQIRVILALFAIASVLITNYVLIADEERERWRDQQIGARLQVDLETLNYWKDYPSKLTQVRSLHLNCINLPRGESYINLDGLKAFPQLDTLTINGDYLNLSFPADDSVTVWPNLKVLKIQNNKHLDLSMFLAACPALEVLDLRNNHLKILPKGLMTLKQLKVLYLGSNNLRALSGIVFEQLEQLHYLDVSNNELMEIDTLMFTLSALDTLLLYSNRLADLNITRGAWPNLKKLDLSSNQMVAIDVEEQAMPKLEWLSLKSNELYYLPRHLLASKSLRVGFFSSNKIHLGNFKAGDWQNLKELYLQGNQLEYVPDSLWLLPNLEMLYLTGSDVFKLAKNENVIIPASRLHTLDLSDNPLEAANLDLLGQLTNLKRLRLLRTNIDQLPQSFAKLNQLKCLDIGSNQFETLPKVTTQLLSLEELYYYDYYTNNFTSINWDSLLPDVEVFNTWSPIY